MKVVNIFFSIVILFTVGCVTDPFVIEVPGPPIEVGTMDTVIILNETDLCENGTISFERQIQPLIHSSCAYSGCHDLRSKQEGVILETYSQIRKERGEIIETITKSPNSGDFMPPKPAMGLTASQIQLIKDWASQGANNTTCNIPCNSENFSFKDNVFPLIQQACIGCHQSSNSSGNINLEDYNHIKAFAVNGQLIGSLKHTFGYDAMPPLGSKFTDCQIATIENWIVDGALNN